MNKIEIDGVEYDADPRCKWCLGTGEQHVANGPDDFDVEPCACLERRHDV